MDRITAMQVFVETAERGSVSAAAQHLDMSRAMASRYVAFVEQWTGARLLHRTTRRLTLTAAGAQMLPLCRDMLGLAEHVATVVAEPGDAPRGALRITASAIFAQTHVTDAVLDYLVRYPAVSVDLLVTDRTADLVDERIDLAIRITNAVDPSLIARRLGTCRSALCASPGYLAEHGAPKRPHDLTRHNCLTYAYFGQSLWHLTRDGDGARAGQSERERRARAAARGDRGRRHRAAADIRGRRADSHGRTRARAARLRGARARHLCGLCIAQADAARNAHDDRFPGGAFRRYARVGRMTARLRRAAP